MTLSPNRAFWVDDAGPYVRRSPVIGNLHVDVAVIGAGYTGLSTAWHVKQLDPTATVVVLESEEVGFGASGRNSGWVMPHLGIGGDMMRQIHGDAKAEEAHEYAIEAVTYTENLIEKHSLDSDFRRHGSIRVALGKKWLPALEAEMEYHRNSRHADRFEWMTRDEVRAEFNSPWLEAGIAERTTSFLQPVKHARELARLCESVGVNVYESTPVIHVSEAPNGIVLTTPGGVVRAERVALGTNAYTHLLDAPGSWKLRRRQFPVFVYGTMTEPLAPEVWDELGWSRRGGLQTTVNGFHTVHPTPDGRLLLAHDGYFGTKRGTAMDGDYDVTALKAITEQWPVILPALKGVKISHFWGGPVSFTPELTPHIGPLGDGRVVGFYGDVGHGVSITHLNGLVLAEYLVTGTSTYADRWFIGRRTKRWPSVELGKLGFDAALRYYRWVDKRQTSSAGIPLRYY